MKLKSERSFTTPIRYLITKGDATPENFNEKKNEILEIVRNASAFGIELVQIREKNLSAKLVYKLTSAAVASGVKIIVNDRFDIALAAGAAGVQLTGKSLGADIVRRSVPSGFLIGVSTHSLEETVVAKQNGADFVVFGPIFETPGKSVPAGTEELRRICLEVMPFPVIGIGGIDESNLQSVLDNGAAGFAAIRYFYNLSVPLA